MFLKWNPSWRSTVGLAKSVGIDFIYILKKQDCERERETEREREFFTQFLILFVKISKSKSDKNMTLTAAILHPAVLYQWHHKQDWNAWQKYQLHHKPTFSLLFIVTVLFIMVKREKSMAASEEKKPNSNQMQKKKKVSFCTNIDKTTKWRPQIQIFAHFHCLQTKKKHRGPYW